MIDYPPYFKARELACRCGECDGGMMDSRFMTWITAMRQDLAFPLIVASGYRCPAYNMRIASSGARGPHTTGKAIDFRLYGERAFDLLVGVVTYGEVTGIGVAQKGPRESRFIHVDACERPGHPRPWVWSY